MNAPGAFCAIAWWRTRHTQATMIAGAKYFMLVRVGRRRVDHGAIPVLDEFAVSHAEGVEGEQLVKFAGLRSGILAIILMDHGHHVAFCRHDFEWISRRRLRTGCLTSSRSAATCLGEESTLEFVVIAHLVLLGTLLEGGIVLLIAWIGKRDS